MSTTLKAIIKADNERDADEVAKQFRIIVENINYSEIEKRHRAVAFGLEINDDGETSAKLEFSLLSEDQKLSFSGTVNDEREFGFMLRFKRTWN